MGEGDIDDEDYVSEDPGGAKSDNITIVDANNGSSQCSIEINNSGNGSSELFEGSTMTLAIDTMGNCSGSMQVDFVPNGTGAQSSDYEIRHNGSPVTLPINPFAYPGSLELELFTDTTSEPNSWFDFTATLPGGINASHRVDLRDYIPCSYTLAADDATLYERDAHPWVETDITVTATGSPSACANTVSVDWAGNGGDGAAEPFDFDVRTVGGAVVQTGHHVQLAGSPGNLAGTLTLRVHADSIVETQSSSVTFDIQSTVTETVTISDDDGSVNGKLSYTAPETAAEEAANFYYCTAETHGELTVKPVSGQSWTGIDKLTFKLGGTAVYGTDYVVAAPGGSSYTVNVTAPYVIVDLGGTPPAEVDLLIDPSPDDDETEGDETVTLELLTAAQGTDTRTVTIGDELEALTIIATDATATENNQDHGVFAVRAADGTSPLCTQVRLVLDTTVASSASPVNSSSPRDYQLQESLQSDFLLVTDEGGGSYSAAPFPETHIALTGQTQVLIDVIPDDDSDLEGAEIVRAQVEARNLWVPGTWLRSPDVADVTIQDNTPAAILDAEIEIDLEPDNECVVCSSGVVGVDLQSGSPSVPIVPGFLEFLGEGTHGTQPVVRGQFEKPSGGWPSTITVKVEVDDWDNSGSIHPDLTQQTPPTFTLNTASYGDSISFAVPVDVEGLDTGSYRVKLIGTGGSEQWTAQASHFLINRWDNNDIAPGLAFSFLKQIVPDTKAYLKGSGGSVIEKDGVALVRGDNSVSWYEEEATNQYKTPPESVSDLTVSGDLYIVTDRFGNEDHFAKNQFSELVGGVSKTWHVGQHYKSFDRNGDAMLFVYNSSQQLESITDPLNRTTNLAYNPQGTLLTVTLTDFAGRVTTLSYDTSTASAPELEVLYPDPDIGYDVGPQPKDTFLFNSQDQLLSITRDAQGSPGSVNQYTLDTGNANLDGISVLAPTGVAPNRGHHSASWQNPVRQLDVDRSGSETGDDIQEVIDDVDSQGLGAIDPNREPGSGFVDTSGDGVVSALDAILVINHVAGTGTTGSGANPDYNEPEDTPVSYTYTPDVSTDSLPNGLLLTETRNTGRGNLITEYDYYDGSETDGASGPVRAGRYGLVETITYAKGTSDEASVSFKYDANGNATQYIDEIGRVTKFEFDHLDRLAKLISADPDGTSGPEQSLVTEYVYDAFSNIARTTVRNFNPVFDADGDPSTDPDTVHTTCSYYDTMDRLVWQVDPHPDQDTDLASCQLTSLPPSWTAAQTGIWAGRPITHYSAYDGNSNLESVTDAEGRTTDFVYDDLNRLTQITQPGLLIEPNTDASLSTGHGEVLATGNRPVTTFVYDNLGNLWSSTDSLGNTTEFRYDAWNRPLSISEPQLSGGATAVTTFDYSKLQYGWVHRMTDAEGRMTETQLDFIDRLEYVARPADVDGRQPTTWYDYYRDSQLLRTVDAEGNATSYTYDDRARLETVVQPSVWDAVQAQNVQPTTTYVYDAANQLTKVIDPLSRETTYGYDDLGRIELVTPPDPDNAPGGELPPTMQYTYDAAGNLLQTTDALSHTMGYVLPTELRSHFLPNYGGRDIGGLAGRFAELL